MLRPGDRFAGYVLLAPLGRGGQGEVYRAHDPHGREVALKILRADFSNDPETSGRFRREMRLSTTLRCSHLIPAHACGEHEGRLWLASTLATEGTLRDHLRRTGPMDPDSAARLACDLAEALVTIADAGLVHRDVKPSNVLRHDGFWKLTDLGLARSLAADASRYTGTGLIVGTPNYIAPELIDGTPPSPASDIYALGCLLIEVLTGKPPFRGLDELDTLRRHCQDAPPDLRELPGERGQLLAALIQRMLAKEPASRPQHPREILVALHQNAERPFPATLREGEIPPTLGDGDFPKTMPEAVDAQAATHSLESVKVPQVRAPFVATLPAVTLAGDTLAEPDGGDRVRIDLPQGGILFAYAGARLRAGRAANDREGQDCCLRLLPSLEHADANRRISERHIEFTLGPDGAMVRDSGSTHGTVMDGQRLIPHRDVPVVAGLRIIVADVLTIHILHADHQALLIARTGNRSDIGYVLVRERIDLTPYPLAAGAPQLLVAQGGTLYQAGVDGGMAPLRPTAGPPRIAALQAKDQK